MIVRTHDFDALAETVKFYDDNIDLDAEAWMAAPENIALTDELGNLGVFEYVSPGVYTGHYFFGIHTRGRKAKALALEMLKEAFGVYDIKAIRGLTPLQNLAARWMSRQLGFKSYGVVTHPTGPCELFIMTRDEFILGISNG